MPKEAAQGRRTKRKTKDPAKPKRALSAYMFFATEHRESIKEQFPEAGFGEIGKRLGEAWKNLPEDDKKPYNEKAKKDKERYEREMKDYGQ
ncbi:high mobility group box domain-containing protein [Syncephalis pseudoplumigaleata]|uniref:High mobility group box domain-containing protein n=1 Tax=Syncephalis pseudoplumigaleata TaxID=1712513 RepID=A0A4P9YZP1_9FUNG|nr:high mobility group box domain-containing protein [Syncephalis pseudoplumigaleata]|eukprot:RKP25425.1 high mobility group box domain-containing protein [Syncephalis pseudoplumigaleata]